MTGYVQMYVPADEAYRLELLPRPVRCILNQHLFQESRQQSGYFFPSVEHALVAQAKETENSKKPYNTAFYSVSFVVL